VVGRPLRRRLARSLAVTLGGLFLLIGCNSEPTTTSHPVNLAQGETWKQTGAQVRAARERAEQAGEPVTPAAIPPSSSAPQDLDEPGRYVFRVPAPSGINVSHVGFSVPGDIQDYVEYRVADRLELVERGGHSYLQVVLEVTKVFRPYEDLTVWFIS
jgi:hypothetical protein